MKEKLLELLNEYCSIEYLKTYFHIESATDLVFLMKTINSLVEEGTVYENEKHEYILAKKAGFYTGVISIKNKVAFLQQETDDIYVDLKHNLARDIALDGDLIIVKVYQAKNRNHEYAEAYIYKVLKRKKVIGKVKRGRKANFYLDTNEAKIDIIEANKKHLNKLYAASVFSKIVKKRFYLYCKLEECIANENDQDRDVKKYIYTYGLTEDFDPEVIQEAKKLKPFADYDKRVDLRNDMTITIDSLSAKDLDDAVCLKKQQDKYILKVSIADVSYYVKENSYLDQAAYKRGTSVYLTDRVIPMLPERLSNDLCSLNYGTDKACLTVEMLIDQNAKVLKHKFYPSVIRSYKRMSYEHINEMFAKKRHYVPELEEMLYTMLELQKKLYAKRHERGSFNFESNELLITLNNYEVEDVKIKTRGLSERIIEEFMILANETVAEHFYWLEYPFLYRIHETPDYDKIKNIISLANHKGYKFKGDYKNQKMLQNLIDKLQTSDDAYIANQMLLRTMAKARYSSSYLSHYGLASKYYCHFTSPIRRYPDLIVHRLIRALLFSKKISGEVFNHFENILPEIAKQTSLKERNAVQIERDVEKYFLCKYMHKQVGKVFKGTITTLTKFGMYVELANGIEGMVHVKNMSGYFEYDDKKNILTNGKIIYNIGEKLNVKCIASDEQKLIIDFKVV